MTSPSYNPAGVHFAAGAGEDSSLAAQSQRWTQLSAASAETPHSVLNQLSPSPIAANLSAPAQQDRLLKNGFVLPNNSNGASAPTTETDNYLRMGGEPE